MKRPFIACCKFFLDLVFKVNVIIENFHIETFEGGTNCYLWVCKIFVLHVETSIEELPNKH